MNLRISSLEFLPSDDDDDDDDEEEEEFKVGDDNGVLTLLCPIMITGQCLSLFIINCC